MSSSNDGKSLFSITLAGAKAVKKNVTLQGYYRQRPEGHQCVIRPKFRPGSRDITLAALTDFSKHGELIAISVESS